MYQNKLKVHKKIAFKMLSTQAISTCGIKSQQQENTIIGCAKVIFFYMSEELQKK